MTVFENLIAAYQYNRTRTLALLDAIEKESDPQAVLAWRPGPGRAHIAWQLMHVGVTEELFATERLSPGKPPTFTELWPRFRGGSTPDDDIPAAGLIRRVLAESREHLLATLRTLREDQLDKVPEGMKERGLPLLTVLHIISWHESHHQGQAHITFNLFKAARG